MKIRPYLDDAGYSLTLVASASFLLIMLFGATLAA